MGYIIILDGYVPPQCEKQLRQTLDDCYRKLGSPKRGQVEIHIVDTASRMEAFLQKEKAELGIETTGEEGFLCTHDAWRGVPRLLICIERLSQVPKVASLGIIRHEVAHTILHGDPLYYMFTINNECQTLAQAKGIDTAVLKQIVYYISVAVKDFEATRFLVNHNCVECQAAFALEQLLKVTADDKLAWLLAKSIPRARALYLAAQLKPLLFVHPLLAVADNREQLMKSVSSMLEHMGQVEQTRLFQFANRLAEQLKYDTHGNIGITLTTLLKQL